MAAETRVGVAGWSLPRALAEALPGDGSHLERYGRRLGAVEINSSFYRPHRRATYERWAASVPADFRFAVKAPRSITHERRLQGVDDLLAAFLDQAGGLGPKLGPLLVQLPPSLRFEADAASSFFEALREGHGGPVACEPRHASWFEAEAEALLEAFQVGRVAADPPTHPRAAAPGGWPGLAYWRWHGRPRIYYSDYDDQALAGLAAAVKAASANAETWCILDNTALGYALSNALTLQARLNA